MNCSLIFIFFTLVLLLGRPALAAPAAEPMAKIQGLLLNADDMFRDTENDTVELSGRVQIVSQDRHILAEKARISLRTRQVDLEGSVRLTTTTATIGGDRMLLDYESGTGVIYNGFVQSGPVIFEGALIQKTGPDEYFVADADYTACTNCPAGWSFRGTTIRAELGGYAYIKNSVLRFGSLPILWLPYLVVPLKSDRQSGLLTPGFEQSSAGGLAISQPYFWAISRSTDATFTVKNYELRGMKGLTNYRYLLSENSGGEVDVGMIQDRVFKDDVRLNKFRNNRQKNQPIDRWFLRYQHYQELPSGWVHRAQINAASDLQYPRDFPGETLNHGDSAMENRISMTKNTESSHFSVDSSYYTSLLQGNPQASNEESVHRLPEIRYAQTLQPVGRTGLFYSLDLNATNFTRSAQAYDNLSATTFAGNTYRYVSNTCSGNSGLNYGSDPACVRTEDGAYNSTTDLIRTGQRVDLQPTLMKPFTFTDGVDVVPKLSYRETHYNFPVGTVTNNVRRYVRAEVASRMSFNRIYGDLNDPKATRYKHEIRPEVTYTSLPWIDHKSHPFFGFSSQTEAPTFESLSVNDADLAGDAGLQFDYRDRIYDRNLVTYSVVNTITEKRWLNDLPIYRQLALVKISQSYDAWKDSRSDPNKQPWSDISSLVDLRFDHVQSYGLLNYYPYQKVTNSSVRVRVNDDEGRFVQLGQVKQFTIVPGKDVDSTNRVEDYSFAAGFVARYLNFMGKLTYDSTPAGVDRRLKSWAYIAQLKPPGDCWIVTFIHDQITGGDTNLKLNFEFTFDGVQKPPLPPETLDSFGF